MQRLKIPEFRVISPELIDVGAQLIRTDVSDQDIAEFAASLLTTPLLQPIGVTPKEDGRFQLRWGWRRLQAHKLNKAPGILSRIFEGSDDEIKSLAIIENIDRKQLSLKEECDVVIHLHNVEHKSPDEICSRLSRSRNWVDKRLALPNFPPEIVDACMENAIGLAVAEELALLDDEKIRRFALQQAINARLSLREVRALVQEAKNFDAVAPATEAAVQAGLAVRTTTVIYSDCQACNRRAPIHQLALVRVHKDGCPEDDEVTLTEKGEQDNGRA